MEEGEGLGQSTRPMAPMSRQWLQRVPSPQITRDRTMRLFRIETVGIWAARKPEEER